MQKLTSSKQFVINVWRLTKSYWQSEEKKKAYLLLAAIIALTLGTVYVTVLLNSWSNAFYSALQEYRTDDIVAQMWQFTKLAFIFVIMAVYAYYLQKMLVINWRRWLTQRYIDEWLENKTYYRLQMFGVDTDNPDQRISEDVRLFVEMTLQFTIGLLKAFTTLLSFIVILWELSGPLSFAFLGTTWHIEGYLVWLALIYAVAGTWLTYKVGNKLVGYNYVQQRYEADFRFSMMRMRENAESVAFYAGEQHESAVLKGRFTTLLDNFWLIVRKQKQLIWINAIYSQLAVIFPLAIVLPRYFSRQMNLGGLMQISAAFARVQESLSYFVDMYATIAEWQAVVERLTGFGLHMNAVKSENPQQDLTREVSGDNCLTMAGMEVDLPNGKSILENIQTTLKPGINVLIKGPSGSGKSTILRAIAGIWPYVKGRLVSPEAEKIMFIPQKPYLPLGTLRDALLYPGKQERTDEELKHLMEACHIGYLSKYMREEADWSHVFSVGEQQRLAFVRAMVYQPSWLFMDESTSALDEATEAAMYQLLDEQMPNTTIVSVGHRSTLTKFHQATLLLDKDAKTMTLQPTLA